MNAVEVWGGTLNPMPRTGGPASLYHGEGKMGDSGGDKSLSASPWVSNHTRGHRQSVFEALPLHVEGPALWPPL